MTLSTWRTLLSLVLGLALTGCAGDPGPVAEEEPSVPASGIVTFGGKPLNEHQVVLMPDDGRRPAVGFTDAEGKFTLGTNAPGDGAPPGKAKVAVVWSGPQGEVSVEQSAVNSPSQMPKPSVKIPAKYSNPETSGLTADIPAGGTSDLKFNLQ